jgi:hypothetical protein
LFNDAAFFGLQGMKADSLPVRNYDEWYCDANQKKGNMLKMQKLPRLGKKNPCPIFGGRTLPPFV